MLIKLRKTLRSLKNWALFSDSTTYWESRYAQGGNSGQGSYGRLSEFKRNTLNQLIKEYSITSAIEFGCGDGAQLHGIGWSHYLGVDVSASAVARCQSLYASDNTKTFITLDQYEGQKADAALSLDVIYHLVEDAVFDSYMLTLFTAAKRLVIIYSTNFETRRRKDPHVRNREFTRWVNANAKDWKITQQIPNPFRPSDPCSPRMGESAADFFIYLKVSS